MRLFVSFSARKDGNSDEIARYLAKEDDQIIYFRDLNVHNCSNCDYECFETSCKYCNDDIYNLLEEMCKFQKVILIIPMYCGNPCSLYFVFNERCQDYFMHNDDKYENLVKRLFIVGLYGDLKKQPYFISCLEKWFEGTKYTNHVLGVERHNYNFKLKDSVLEVEEIKKLISEFINPTKAKIELSAMAVVMCNGKILSTNEMIYGKETLSLPKGHKEENETIIETAIRECYEETNIIVIKDDLVKELTSFSYEFLTPSNKLIRKTIVPFLFEIKEEGNPIPKEERMISVQWMDINEFLEKCTHENVKEIVKEI
jgi:mutT protein